MKRRTTFRSRRGIAQHWMIIGGVAAALVVGVLLFKMLKKDDRHDNYRHDGFQDQQYSQTYQDQQDWRPPQKGGYGNPPPHWRDDGRGRHGGGYGRGDLDPVRRYGPGAPDSDSDVPAGGEDPDLARLKAAVDSAQLRLETASSDASNSGAMMDAQSDLTSAKAALAAKIQSMM